MNASSSSWTEAAAETGGDEESSSQRYTTTSIAPEQTPSSDFFFMVGVVTPLVVCCFAIFFCAVNSLWKTRQNLERLSTMETRPLPDYTEFTIDITTKMDSCVEMSSAPGTGNEEARVGLALDMARRPDNRIEEAVGSSDQFSYGISRNVRSHPQAPLSCFIHT